MSRTWDPARPTRSRGNEASMTRRDPNHDAPFRSSGNATNPPVSSDGYRPLFSFAFLMRSPYLWAMRWLWICVTVTIVTLKKIIRPVPTQEKEMQARGIRYKPERGLGGKTG